MVLVRKQGERGKKGFLPALEMCKQWKKAGTNSSDVDFEFLVARKKRDVQDQLENLPGKQQQQQQQ